MNICHVEIVDTFALLPALDEGSLAGATIGVFETEPLAVDSALRVRRKVFATLHVGFVTREIHGSMKNVLEWMDLTTSAQMGGPEKIGG